MWCLHTAAPQPTLPFKGGFVEHVSACCWRSQARAAFKSAACVTVPASMSMTHGHRAFKHAEGAPVLIVLAQHIEQEGVHVVVQGFVVQEQLGQQAQALAVHLPDHRAVQLCGPQTAG